MRGVERVQKAVHRDEEGERERERGDGLKEEKRQGRVRGVERVQKAVYRQEEGEREREAGG